jgi:hypothetical protein
VAGGDRHVVRHAGKAEAAGSPRVGVVVVVERVRGLLSRKESLALEPCLSSLQVHLPSPQAILLHQEVS